MNIRERFEEIWPVPEEIFWSEGHGEYWPVSNGPHDAHIAEQWDARLDTFTRCQETTSIHMSLIDELAQSLQWYVDEDEINEGDPENKYWVDGKHEAEALLDSAKQITEQKK